MGAPTPMPLGTRQHTHRSAPCPLQWHQEQPLGLSLVAAKGWDSNPPGMAAASTTSEYLRLPGNLGTSAFLLAVEQSCAAKAMLNL